MFLEKSVSFGRGIQIKKLSSTEQTDENINKVLRVFTEPLIQLERLSKALSEKQMREPLVNRTSGGAWVGVGKRRLVLDKLDKKGGRFYNLKVSGHLNLLSVRKE